MPVFPRWFAYFQLWCAVGVGLTFGVYIVKTGPLAWNGILGFWIPVSFYFIWVVVTTLVTARAIKNDDDSDPESLLLDRVARLETLVAEQLNPAVRSAPHTARIGPAR